MGYVKINWFEQVSTPSAFSEIPSCHEGENEQAFAIQDFYAETSDGLSVKQGDILVVLERIEGAQTWKCMNSIQEEGSVPVFCLQLSAVRSTRELNENREMRWVENSYEQRIRTTISRDMTASEIIPHLIKNGCRDVTNNINIDQCGAFPVAGGGFGDVYKGRLLTGEVVAIKCPRLFPAHDDKKSNALKNIAQEIYTWSKLKHGNVLEMIGFATFRGHIAVVSPWMVNDTLLTYISKHPNVDRFQLCFHICAGLAYLHALDVVHGDLKGINVLVSDTGVPKLTDFGNTLLKKYTLEFSGTTGGLNMSVRWTAPEILSGKSTHTKQADIYALGMTFLETLTGNIPFIEIRPEPAVMFHVISGRTPERPKEVNAQDKPTQNLWGIMSRCWTHDAANRPTILEVKNYLARFSDVKRYMASGAYNYDHSGPSTSYLPISMNPKQLRSETIRSMRLTHASRAPANQASRFRTNRPDTNYDYEVNTSIQSVAQPSVSTSARPIARSIPTQGDYRTIPSLEDLMQSHEGFMSPTWIDNSSPSNSSIFMPSSVSTRLQALDNHGTVYGGLPLFNVRQASATDQNYYRREQ